MLGMPATRLDQGGEPPPPPSLFDELGGEPVLRPIVDRFVERIFADPMIGFFFRKANRRRVADKEYELAAQHLGGGVEYTGRPLRQAHAAHPIMGGQFARRLTILRETLIEAGAPARVIEHWLAYTESQRALVTRDPEGQCNGTISEKAAITPPPAIPPRSSRKASDP
jgi:hemoglobin